MSDDLSRARQLLETGDYTCVLCKGQILRTCTARGVRPLVDLLHEGQFSGFSAADKVIGKATAFLYVLLDIQAVYTPVASEAAIRILQEHQIEIHCDMSVPAIYNRSHTGFCPMETAVGNLEDPDLALAVIVETLHQLLHRQT